MKGLFALGLSLALLAGVFAGVAAPAKADFAGAWGGGVTVALQSFGTADPRLAGPADRKVLELVYDSLARIDPETLELRPWAATSWGWDNDKNITATVRTDLSWSDGTPYDAYDVAAALRMYKVGPVSRWQVAATDARTLSFNFVNVTAGEAGPGLFYTEGLTALIAWDKNGSSKFSGPFAIQSQSANTLVLAANPHHFSGRPNLNTVTYRWPFTLDYKPNNTTQGNDAACALMFQQVQLIGWPLLANDLTNPRDCQDTYGGFPNGENKSLGNPANKEPFVQPAKNPGNDFMYFGFTFSGTSPFAGAPGSSAQKLRSAIYKIVNKQLYRNFEPDTTVTHSVINRVNAPWAPDSCPPWTPCAFVQDANSIPQSPLGNSKTDTDPAYLALDAAGFLDRNGDGFREDPAGAPLSFHLLAPSLALDPRKNGIASDLVFQLRGIDVAVTIDLFATGAALEANITSCTTGCMYLKRFTQATQLPDWIYGMPEVTAANDPDVNLHLNLGTASFTVAERALHVGHVGHLLGADADLLPVLSYDTLEAYDFVAVTGWVNTLGGVNNFWTFKNLRLPSQGPLSAAMSIFPTLGVGPGQNTTVQVEVRDAAGTPVPGATVDLTAEAGVGTLIPASGVTGSGGILTATYSPPSTVAASADVTISAIATKVQYGGATASAVLTIHPAPPNELAVAVNRGPLPEIGSGNQTTITVEVTDATTGVHVSGANVTLHTDLPGATFTPASGQTDRSGIFTATFKANVTQGVQYRITADVSYPSYVGGSGSASLSVKTDYGTVTPIDRQKNVPGFETPVVLGAIAVVFLLVALVRRRRHD